MAAVINLSLPFLFSVILTSLNFCIKAILNTGECSSAFISWYVQSVSISSLMCKAYIMVINYPALRSFDLFPLIVRMVQSILQELLPWFFSPLMIFPPEFRFKKLSSSSSSSEILFSNIFLGYIFFNIYLWYSFLISFCDTLFLHFLGYSFITFSGILFFNIYLWYSFLASFWDTLFLHFLGYSFLTFICDTLF